MIYPQNLHTPKNNDISETPKNIEIQDLTCVRGMKAPAALCRATCVSGSFTVIF